MSLRWRILLFLAILLADSWLVSAQPWAMLIGVAAYLVVVLPALR